MDSPGELGFQIVGRTNHYSVLLAMVFCPTDLQEKLMLKVMHQVPVIS